MSTSPLVSVIIPTYNRVKALPRAIASVQQQGYPNLDLIIVDDGSTDGTVEWLRAAHPSCNYVFQENRGPSAARNRGLKQARGEFIAFLDSDDEWLPGSLQTRLSVLQQRPDIDLVFSDFRNFIAGHPETQSFFKTRTVFKQLRRTTISDDCFTSDNMFDCLLIQPFVQPSTVVLRRNMLREDEYFDEQMTGWEDWDLWIRMSRAHRFGLIERVLAHRHIEGDNLGQQGEKELEREVFMWRKWRAASGLTTPQQLMIKQRLAKALCDLGYLRYWDKANHSESRRLFWQSLRIRPRFTTIKCLAYSCIPCFDRLQGNRRPLGTS